MLAFQESMRAARRHGRHAERLAASRRKAPILVQLLPVSDAGVSINVGCRGRFYGFLYMRQDSFSVPP